MPLIYILTKVLFYIIYCGALNKPDNIIFHKPRNATVLVWGVKAFFLTFPDSIPRTDSGVLQKEGKLRQPSK